MTCFEHPILNSPYADEGRHRELDDDGQPDDQGHSTVGQRYDLTTVINEMRGIAS